jgi:hypothetical protein
MLSQVGSTEEHNGGATLDDASMPGQIFSQKGCPLEGPKEQELQEVAWRLVDSWQTKPPCPIGHRFQGTYGD